MSNELDELVDDRLLETQDEYRDEYIRQDEDEQGKCAQWVMWDISIKPVGFLVRVIRMYVDNMDISSVLRQMYFEDNQSAANRAYDWARDRELGRIQALDDEGYHEGREGEE